MLGRSRSRVIKWTVLVVVLGGGIGYFAFRKSSAPGAVTFRFGKVDRGSVEQVVTATGQLSAVITVQVGSQVSGIIQKLGADFNSRVTEGQVIAQLDATRFRANLQQAQANLKNARAASARAQVTFEQAQRDYERGKALADRQVVGLAEVEAVKSKLDLARVDLSSTEAQVAQAQAAVGMARVDLERTTIKAPIDGVVLNRAVDVGQTVAASLQAPVLFTIAKDLSQMEVRAAIDESDVGKLREGLEGSFRVDAYPGEEFVARIHQVRSQPTIQQNVVSYDAILRVENPEGKLRPGMTANVRIVCERHDDVLRVPNTALRFRPAPELIAPSERRRGLDRGTSEEVGGEGRSKRAGSGPGRGGGSSGGGRGMARVYRQEGDKLVPLPFKPGLADDEFTEIVSGALSEGDRLVIDTQGSGGEKSSSSSKGGSAPRPPRFF